MNLKENRIGLTDGEKRELLRLARQAIASAAAGITGVEVIVGGEYPVGESLERSYGVFVTLKQKGALRGCIGSIQTEEPLYRAVVEAAVSSAVRDPRFPPLTVGELEATDIEISVLSTLREVEDTEEIVVGTHGLYLRSGLQAGLLLPQVATEYGWDREEFLEQCCRKAGLERNAWRDKDTEIMIFSALVFGEDRDA